MPNFIISWTIWKSSFCPKNDIFCLCKCLKAFKKGNRVRGEVNKEKEKPKELEIYKKIGIQRKNTV